MNAQTDAEGRYSFSHLARGDYEISVEGATSAAQRVTLSDTPQTLNLTLPQSEETLPSAPSPNTTKPSLQDLGFSASEAQADAKRQALLDQRTHMLKIHQRMGLITTVPLIVSVVTSLNAGGKSESSATRDLHRCTRRADRRSIRNYGILRDSRSQNSRHRDQRPDQGAQDSCLDSWSGHDRLHRFSESSPSSRRMTEKKSTGLRVRMVRSPL